MKQPLISKRSEGSYELSETGLARAYMMTMQRLLVHYAQQALKIAPADAQKLGAGLPGLTAQIIRKLDDYFDKLPLFAAFIKEPNTGRLGAYIGQHFMPQLEKVKEKLLETEIPKFKAEYENPYRVPSNDLLMLFGADFAKTPLLQYKPFDPAGEADEALKAAELVLPGEPAPDSGPRPQPGEILLERYGSVFFTARPLSYVPDTGSDDADSGANHALSAIPQQISFRNCIAVVNTVARFLRAQDQKGYARYYASLPVKQQAAYTFYTLFQKAAQQQEIAWPDEMQKIMHRAKLDAGSAHKLRDEVEAYRRVAQSLQRALAAGQQKGMSPQLAQSLYPQLVAIFENSGNLEEKRTALKMSLLQVATLPAKEAIGEILAAQLEELTELYGLG